MCNCQNGGWHREWPAVYLVGSFPTISCIQEGENSAVTLVPAIGHTIIHAYFYTVGVGGELTFYGDLLDGFNWSDDLGAQQFRVLFITDIGAVERTFFVPCGVAE